MAAAVHAASIQDRLAEPVPAVGQGLGVPQPKRAGFSLLDVCQVNGEKALPEHKMIMNRILYKNNDTIEVKSYLTKRN